MIYYRKYGMNDMEKYNLCDVGMEVGINGIG